MLFRSVLQVGVGEGHAPTMPTTTIYYEHALFRLTKQRRVEGLVSVAWWFAVHLEVFALLEPDGWRVLRGHRQALRDAVVFHW